MWIRDDASPEDTAAVMAEVPAPARLLYRMVLRRRSTAERRWDVDATTGPARLR